MEEQEKVRRTRRKISKDEKIAALQEKITEHELKIKALRQQIDDLNEPQASMRDITARIKELGLPANEVMKALEKLSKNKG
jgi:cell division protein FtsL